MKKLVYSIILSLIFLSVAGCNWTDVHTHSFRHVADSESTCTTKGYIDHWECQECHNVYTKKGCASESTKDAVSKDLIPHDFIYTAGSPSTCIEKGLKEHWECSYCNKLVLDEKGEVECARNELELEDYGPHKPTIHDAGMAATCTETGVKEHWTCEVCNGIFLDANAENGTTEAELLIDMLPHEYKDENGYWTEEGGNTVYRNPCVNCGGAPLKTAPIGTVGPAGGYIFHVDEDSAHELTYYENSPTELPGVVFGYYRTSPSSADLQVGTSAAIGTGKDNTNKLILAMGNAAYVFDAKNATQNTVTTSNYSAKACADYSVSVGGKVFDDWFLPSRSEFEAFRNNIYMSGKYPLPGITQTNYQTSSEVEDWTGAYICVMLTVVKYGSATKSVNLPILPIRSFDGGSAF
jgi:hypothetical protein